MRNISCIAFMTVCACGISFLMPASETKPSAIRLENVKNRPQSPTIKVLLVKDQEGAQVEVKGGYMVYDPFSGKQLDNAFSGASCYMYPTTEGIKWGEEFPGVYQLLLVPKYGSFLVSGIEYRGMLYVYQIEGALAFVNELSIDDFVDSILSSKISPKVTHKEVLAALAIVARADALYRSRDAKSAYYEMKASQWAYQGAGLLRKDLPFQQALQTTKRMVLAKGAFDQSNGGFYTDWFDGNSCKAPVETMQQLADEGMNAKEILHQLYPEATVTLVPS